jgi:hypothetical protein
MLNDEALPSLKLRQTKVEKGHKAAKAQRIAKDFLIKQEAFGCFLFNLLTCQLFNHIFQRPKAVITGQIGQKRPKRT